MTVDHHVEPLSRDLDLRLARLHLRTGALTMARAEYEALVAAGPLGPDDLVHLAEVRWRTGDLAGAGDAAAAHLELGGSSGRALGIAAEAAVAIGRTVEAERLAASAQRRLEESVSEFFAGMPIRAPWPADAVPTGEAMPTVGAAPADAATTAEAVPGPAVAVPAHEPPPQVAETTRSSDQLARMDAARQALADDRVETATLQLAIVLRRDPGLAPAVLDAIDGREGPAFEIVRGDAYRLMGHDADAQASYALAGTALEAVEGRAVDAGSSPASAAADGTESHDTSDSGAVR